MSKNISKILLIICVSLFVFVVNILSADKRIKYYQENIKENKQDLKQIEKSISDKKVKIKESKKRKENISDELTSINKNMNKTKKELTRVKNQLFDVNKKYNNNLIALKETEDKMETLTKVLKNGVRVLYKMQESDNELYWIYAFFDKTSFVAKEKKHYQFKSMLDYNKIVFNEALGQKKSILNIQNNLKTSKLRAEKLQHKFKRKKIELSTSKKRKNELLEKEKKKIQGYEKELKDLNESASELQELIEMLFRKQKIVKSSKNGHEMRFLKMVDKKGPINWPVNGRVLIKFGKQKHPYLDTYHISNGIEISVARGSAVKVVESGKVVYSGKFKRYGNMVIMDHSDGLFSIYANLDKINVKEGQSVMKQNVIAYSGISAFNQKQSLYFEVRVDGFPVDPRLWLK
ncbi:murein hydrolase activator EnvC family protein [bacterium]